MKTLRNNHAFTLIEVLVAAGIIVVLMGVLLGMTDQTQRLMKSTSGKVEQFQEARVAFETMTRRLAQATLNTYWEYDNPVKPTKYFRAADLRFVSGTSSGKSPELLGNSGDALRPGHCVFFHAPNGLVDDQDQYGSLDTLINAWGYFLELGKDENSVPPFLKDKVPTRKRYRMMEFMLPSEKLATFDPQILRADASSTTGLNWFKQFVNQSNRPVRTLAENIVALVILPRLSRADEELYKATASSGRNKPILTNQVSGSSDRWRYDTRAKSDDGVLNPNNQLPPVVQVVLVAIDEPSAAKLEDRYSNDPYLGLDYKDTFRGAETLEDNPNTGAAGDGDLASFEKTLGEKRISYRIFSTNVSIRGSKWSRSQKGDKDTK